MQSIFRKRLKRLFQSGTRQSALTGGKTSATGPNGRGGPLWRGVRSSTGARLSAGDDRPTKAALWPRTAAGRSGGRALAVPQGLPPAPPPLPAQAGDPRRGRVLRAPGEAPPRLTATAARCSRGAPRPGPAGSARPALPEALPVSRSQAPAPLAPRRPGGAALRGRREAAAPRSEGSAPRGGRRAGEALPAPLPSPLLASSDRETARAAPTATGGEGGETGGWGGLAPAAGAACPAGRAPLAAPQALASHLPVWEEGPSSPPRLAGHRRCPLAGNGFSQLPAVSSRSSSR